MRTSAAVALLLTQSLVLGCGEVHGQSDGPIGVDQIAWANPPVDVVPGVVHGTFSSASMNREVGFLIYLPPDYGEADGVFPVVYWLHGRGGNESDLRPAQALHQAIEGGRVQPMVLVLANGGVASGYVDNPSTGVMGESVIVDELVPFVEANYRVNSGASGRGLAGFSMGGAGAARFAIRHPSLWGSVTSVAGVLVGLQELMDRNFIVDAELAQSHDLFAN